MGATTSFDCTLAYTFLFVALGSGEPIVDAAVAVVIDAVTAFFLWKNRTSACAPFSGRAGFFAALARSLAGIATFTIRLATCSTTEAVACEAIHFAIAVIVLTVTDFGFGDNLANASSPTTKLVTLLGSRLAVSFAVSSWGSCVTFAALAGETLATFIDGAIAVVVFPVASFGLFEGLTCTDGVLTAGANARTGLAFPFANVFAVLVLGTSTITGGVAGLGESIDFAVAVVVLVVTDFLFASNFARA